MIMNRKSAKQTSRVSLFIALAMITTIISTLYVQGYQVEYLTDNGVQLCRASIVELFSAILF